MKIEFDSQVRYACDGCGESVTVIVATGIDDLHTHEENLRAVARVAADTIVGMPPSAWALENMPPAWRATVIKQAGPEGKIQTLVTCTQACADRALGRRPDYPLADAPTTSAS